MSSLVEKKSSISGWKCEYVEPPQDKMQIGEYLVRTLVIQPLYSNPDPNPSLSLIME
jgi:hypothetical protein